MKTILQSSRLREGLAFVSRILVRSSISILQLRDGNLESSSPLGRAFFKVGEFDFSVGLKPEPLNAVLAAGAEEVIIDPSGQQVQLQSGNVKLKAHKADLSQLASAPISMESPISLTGEFVEAVKWASLMAHSDPNSDFDHIHIGSHKDRLVASGTDRMNFAVWKTGMDWIGRPDLFIPISAVPLIAQFESPILDSDGNSLSVRDVEKGFSVPLHHDRRSMKFGDLEGKIQPRVGLVNREEFLGLLRAYMGVHAPTGKGAMLACAVELKLEDGGLRLVSDGDQFDGVAGLEEASSGEASVIANAITLSTALDKLDCERVSLHFSDPFSPISVQPAEPNGQLFLAAPMRRDQ